MTLITSIKSGLSNQISLIYKVTTEFYLSIAAALGAFMLWLYYFENEDILSQGEYYKIATWIACLTLFIPASIFLHIYAANKKSKLFILMTGVAALAGILILYSRNLQFELTADFFYPANNVYLTAMLFLSFHGLISIGMFQKHENINGFWQFNKHLLLRTLTGAFYSLSFYLGLIAAIYAVETLFNLEISNSIYPELFIFFMYIYQTIFVLGGIELSSETYQNNRDYPYPIKIFTVYVLIPLMCIYMLIMYVYMVKILIIWSLPKGIISYMVIIFSIAGFLAYLLLYPIRDSIDNKWVKQFSKGLFYLMVPLIILLLMSIGTRINQYGFTTERYCVMLLAIWVTIATVYFILSRRDNIIFIPLSLVILFVLSIIDPWSNQSVSMNSQRQRLSEYLRQFNEKKPVKLSAPMGQNTKDSIEKEISNITEYLLENHGSDALRNMGITQWDVIADSLKNDKTKKYGYISSYPYLNALHIKNPTPGVFQNYFTLKYDSDKQPMEVSGYSQLLTFKNLSSQTGNNPVTLQDGTLHILYGKLADTVDISILVNQAITRYGNENYSIEKPIIIEKQTKGGNYKIIVTEMDGSLKDQKPEIGQMTGYVFLKD